MIYTLYKLQGQWFSLSLSPLNQTSLFCVYNFSFPFDRLTRKTVSHSSFHSMIHLMDGTFLEPLQVQSQVEGSKNSKMSKNRDGQEPASHCPNYPQVLLVSSFFSRAPPKLCPIGTAGKEKVVRAAVQAGKQGHSFSSSSSLHFHSFSRLFLSPHFTLPAASNIFSLSLSSHSCSAYSALLLLLMLNRRPEEYIFFSIYFFCTLIISGHLLSFTI